MINFKGIEQLNMGDRDMLVSSHVEIVPIEHQAMLASIAIACARNFTREPTLVYRDTGLPTYIARLDYTVVGGVPQVYEFEERPSGMGISARVSREFKVRIMEALAGIGDIAVALSSERRATDDSYLGLPIFSISEAAKLKRPLIVRAEHGEEGLKPLVENSISTVLTKGDKRYGEHLKIFKSVDTPEELPDRHTGFALKPRQGSKADGVMLYHPERTAKPGFRAYRKMLQAVSKRPMYLQDLHLPIDTGNPEFPNMIYRLFVDFTKGYPDLIGGCYMARKDAIVHGSVFSVIGSLEVER